MRRDNIIETTAVRRLGPADNHVKVADLIYQTDPYIFPYLFGGDIGLAEDVLIRMIKRDTVYHYRNIRIAECDGEVLGILISMPTPIRVDLQEMMSAFFDVGAAVGERFKRVSEEYYKLLEGEPPGTYIANISVDSRYRGMGIATKMLETVLRDDETYHLETVKANAPAFRLYTKMGFGVDYEYPGFTGVPCLRMTRSAKT